MLIVRNGWFSFRWSQIFDADTGLGGGAVVCKARRQGERRAGALGSLPAEEVAATIRAEKPEVVFAPHVETSSGIILSDDYIRTVSAAAHQVGAAVRAGLHCLGRDLGGHAGPRGWTF